MEGYPSGRRGLIANELVRGNLERGFESLTLRQNRLIRACSYQAILKEGQGITKFFPHPPPIPGGIGDMDKMV